MGGSQSSNAARGGAEAGGVKSLETKLRGTGDLAALERAFSHLTASSSQAHSSTVSSQSLEASFGLAPIFVDEKEYPELSKVVSRFGSAVVQGFFDAEKEEISWAHLLQGFENSSQSSGGNGLKLLLSVYSRAIESAPGSISSKVVYNVPDSGTSFDVVGYLTGSQLRDFLWLSWLLMCDVRLPSKTSTSKLQAFPPNVDRLVLAAVNVCDVSKANDTSSDQSGLEKELSINETSSWVLSTIPTLDDCLARFLRTQLERVPMKASDRIEEKVSGTSHSSHTESERLDQSQGSGGELELPEKNDMLLQSGVAWAIGLSLRDKNPSEILFRASCGLVSSPEMEYPNLLYRSSIHGRGMNRFWACVQGYQSSTLFLIMARNTEQGTTDVSEGEKFILGCLIPSGFDNKQSFYGASGSCLYALDPIFLPIRSTGREKNFVYSHKDIPGTSYRAQPKPEGVGFGGTYGKERIWINEDFGTLTVRHHAFDKTYHAGALVPNQGYAPVVARIVDVEVWGLGGKSADQDQAKFLNRENLFSEQRRKVDLKTMFGTWQNSPEKMMMDMVSDPNAPGREDR